MKLSEAKPKTKIIHIRDFSMKGFIVGENEGAGSQEVIVEWYDGSLSKEYLRDLKIDNTLEEEYKTIVNNINKHLADAAEELMSALKLAKSMDLKPYGMSDELVKLISIHIDDLIECS